jgi:alpha-beta hydrolase superfamily lysophospholipase
MNEQGNLENEELTWQVDGIPVSGTLTRPAGDGTWPGVAFVAGSGPTDRDWNSPLVGGSNGSARLLAEILAGDGFVTLRYDKRASGPHAKENVGRLVGKASLQSHVDELNGAVTALIHRPDVHPDRIFALTNSEGAIHALNYQREAKDHRFAGLVLTAMPGRSIADTMRSQIVPQLATLPDGEVMIRHYDAAVADFLAGRPVEPDPSLPEFVKAIFLSLTNPANLPFARELLDVDPAQLLPDVPEPALVVIGKKDIQVNWRVDGQLLQAAATDRDNITFVFPENANHLLKYEDKPRDLLTPAEVQATYNSEERRLDPQAVEVIRNWLEAHSALVDIG